MTLHQMTIIHRLTDPSQDRLRLATGHVPDHVNANQSEDARDRAHGHGHAGAIGHAQGHHERAGQGREKGDDRGQGRGRDREVEGGQGHQRRTKGAPDRDPALHQNHHCPISGRLAVLPLPPSHREF